MTIGKAGVYEKCSVRAALLREIDKPLTVEDVAIEGPRPGEVRLRVAASGVCRSDLSVASGVLRSPMPVVLGHEVAGVVIEAGEGVRDPKPGDRVVVSLSPACGDCFLCKEGHPELCVRMAPGMIGSTMLDGTTRLRSNGETIYQLCGVAGFAEEAIVCARACIPVPEPVALERACLIGCGVLTGAGAALNTPEVRSGAGVAVVGCGGVGLSAIQGARISGADPIVAIEPDAEKRTLAEELGATHTVDPVDDPVAAVRAISRLGVHVAIEAVGRPETIELAWSLLRPTGLAVVIGMPAARDRVSLRVGGFFQEKRIVGSVYGNADPRQGIPRLLAHVQTGELRLDPLVTEELPLSRAQEALDRLRQGRGARHVVRPGLT